MPPNNRVYWGLSEASAWVVFRDPLVVDLFSPPQPESWVAYMMYPSHWSAAQIGEQLEIFAALKDGRLSATGRSADAISRREAIPAIEWSDLIPDVDGPYRRLEDGTKAQPWIDILVSRADVERLWRRTSEVEGRSKFSKVWFQDRYRQLKEANPGSSKNELMEDLSDQFQEETRREAPSRSSLQNYLKGL
jgi:hypothetical protein